MSNSTITKTARLGRFQPMLLAGAVSLLIGAAANDLGARNLNPGIAPPQAKPHGKTYSQWAAAWWQWASSIPADENPLLDATGEHADVDQNGSVWFLAGNVGGVSQREVTVPEGKALFFPIYNQFYLGYPCDARNLPGCEVDEALEQANDVATLLSFISGTMDGAILSCEIDGIPVEDLKRYRLESDAIFAVTLPENHIYSEFGLPGGPYHPCVDTGYYLFLEPLKKGLHTIHFRGEAADHSAFVEVTYRLHVGKAPVVVPPDQRYRGKTSAEWAATWQRWAIGLPLDGHPFLDTPDFDIQEGQVGSVWFLAAPFGTVERSGTIPGGKALFLGVLNAECSNLEAPPFFGATEVDQRACAKILADHIVNPFCTIDGEPVVDLGAYRVASPQYKFKAPDPNILGVPPGHGTSVTDGIWVMLEPLSRGAHTIHFGGAFHFGAGELGPDPVDLPIDMTYHLQVR